MAITNNILLRGTKGNIGKDLICKTYGDKTVISKYPDMSKVKYSKRQKNEQRGFADAVAYARSIVNDPAKKAELQEKLPKGKRAFNAAVSEYMKQAERESLA